jgi:hypothetical protein
VLARQECGLLNQTGAIEHMWTKILTILAMTSCAIFLFSRHSQAEELTRVDINSMPIIAKTLN